MRNPREIRPPSIGGHRVGCAANSLAIISLRPSAIFTLGAFLALTPPATADAPLVRSGNGNVLGFATGVLEHQGIVVLSLTRYRFVVMRGTGWLRGPVDDASEFVYFDNPGCLGTPYFPRSADQYRGVGLA